MKLSFLGYDGYRKSYKECDGDTTGKNNLDEVVEICNKNESCAGVRNLNCDGQTYQTCNKMTLS